MKLIAEIGLNHLGNDSKAISIVKKCLTLDIDGITLQVQPTKYYNNKKIINVNLRKKRILKYQKLLKKEKSYLD